MIDQFLVKIDRENKKFLSTEDIKKFLRENRIKYSETNLDNVLRVYDSDIDNQLNYEVYNFLITFQGF